MREATEIPTSQRGGLKSRRRRNLTLVSLDDLAGRKSLHLYEFVLQPHGPMKRRCCFSLKHLFCAVGILSGIAAAILWQFRRIEGECEVEKITIRQLETSKSVDFVSAIPEWLQGLERFICGKNNDYIVHHSSLIVPPPPRTSCAHY